MTYVDHETGSTWPNEKPLCGCPNKTSWNCGLPAGHKGECQPTEASKVELGSAHEFYEKSNGQYITGQFTYQEMIDFAEAYADLLQFRVKQLAFSCKSIGDALVVYDRELDAANEKLRVLRVGVQNMSLCLEEEAKR